MSGLVLPEHRPTLRDELSRLRRGPRRLVVAGLVLLVVVFALLLVRRDVQPGPNLVHRGAVSWNLRYGAPLKRVAPHAGELLRLEWRSGGRLLASYVITPLHLPAYRGDVGGAYPLVAARDQAGLMARYPQLEPVEEGKARVNAVPAYSSTFRISRHPRDYGRVVLIAQPVPGAREGVRISMTSTPKAGADKADDVAASGALKTPYRTFRFGTEGP